MYDPGVWLNCDTFCLHEGVLEDERPSHAGTQGSLYLLCYIVYVGHVPIVNLCSKLQQVSVDNKAVVMSSK